jgi:hypothetical protein
VSAGSEHVPGPACPVCSQPGLRATAVPGRFRCLSCLTRFALRSDCPGCGSHATIARMSDTGDARCRNCGSSMLTLA